MQTISCFSFNTRFRTVETNIMNTLEAKFFILDTMKEVWPKFQEILDCGELPPVEFEIKATNCAGFAYYTGKVKFNLAYFCTHSEIAELVQIVAHELAHIVQYRCYPKAKQGHGPEFKMILALAGFQTNTYHTMSASKAKSAVKTLQNEIVLLSL